MHIDNYLKPTDIHEVNKQESENTLLIAILCLIMFILHGLNAYMMLWKGMSPLLFVFLHVVFSAITWLYASVCYKKARDSRFAFLLALSTAFIGPFGAAGTLLALILHYFHSEYSQTFADWFNTIFPHVEMGMAESVHYNILTGRDETSKSYSVIPFQDVLVIGSESQKRVALSRMTSQFHPSFAPAFARALKDPSNTIRVQAATAIAKIEDNFLQKLIALSRVYDQYKSDPDVVMALAQHYDDYAYTGILDDEYELINRSRALDLYKEYYVLRPDDARVRLTIGRLLIRAGKLLDAREWLKQCMDEGYSTPTIVGWYMEALYQLELYSELRQISTALDKKAEEIKDYPASMVKTVRMWSTLEKGAA